MAESVPASEPQDVVVLAGASKAFGGVTALADVTVAVRRGEVTGLIGPNGAGKTTLVNAVSGVIKLDAGEVSLNARSIGHLRPAERARLGIMRTFQRVRLFPQLTVLENASAYLWARGRRRLAPTKRAEVLERLDQFGLGKSASQYPRSLTFGALRRLEIVRCLVVDPELLMLDEPAAGMNPDEARTFVELMRGIQREERLSILLIEHNMDVVMQLADFVHVLNFGTPIASGTPAEVRGNAQVIEAYLGPQS